MRRSSCSTCKFSIFDNTKTLFKLNICVTNKEICLVSVFSYLCKVLCHLFARLLIDKKTFFSSQLELQQVGLRLYCVAIVYDIIRFQIVLVILASSKNFDN